MLLLIVLVGVGNHHGAISHCRGEKLQLADEEIEHLAKVAERERIARDLHDLLGHTLSLITLKAELARKLVDRDPQRAKQEMQDVEHTSRAALADVREAISGYRGAGSRRRTDARPQDAGNRRALPWTPISPSCRLPRRRKRCWRWLCVRP